jgi:transposase
LHQPYGWSQRGELVFGEVSGKRYDRESFVAAKVGDKILAPFCYRGTCNTILFNMWLEKILIPTLSTGQVVIMDNATFHKSQKTKELIENAGCTLKFLPPYSPDLNPIETFWANFKATLRKIINQFQSLSKAIDHVFCM